MRKFDFITIGGATRDIFFKTDGDWILKTLDPTRERMMCFEYGAKVIPRDVHFSFGGGALNTAISFARLGLKASTIISLGCDETADAILENLKKERVEVGLAVSKGLHRTGVSVIIVDRKGDHTAILYRGTNDKLNIVNWDFFKKTQWVYLSSLTGESEKILPRFSREAKKHNKTKLAWNPGYYQIKAGYQKLKNLLLQTDVFIVNKDEATELVLSKDKNCNLKDVKSLILEIEKWGPKIVLITDGANGAYAFDGKKIYEAQAVKTKVMDTTGAGDSFGSSFVAGLELSGSIEKSLALASINASSVVSHIGAQNGLLPLNKIKNLKKVKVKLR